MHNLHKSNKPRETRISPFGGELEVFRFAKHKNGTKTSQSPKIKVTLDKHKRPKSKQKPLISYCNKENKENEPPLINVNLSQSHLFKNTPSPICNPTLGLTSRKKAQSLHKQTNPGHKHYQSIGPILQRTDLSKCQVHQNSIQIPLAKYLVENEVEEFLCCEICLHSMNLPQSAKISQLLTKSHTKRSSDQINTSKQSFGEIVMRISQLQKVRINMGKYEELIKSITVQELSKHSAYYENLVLFIRKCQIQSEDSLKALINENQQKIRQASDCIEECLSTLKKANKEIMQMCAINKSFGKERLQSMCTQVLEKTSNYQQSFKLKIPIAFICLDSQIVQKFQQTFNSQFRLQWVCQEQFTQNSVNKSFMQSLQNSLKGHHSSMLQRSWRQSSNEKRKSLNCSKIGGENMVESIQLNSADLFCHQSIDVCSENSSLLHNERTNNGQKLLFSFQRNPFEFMIPEQIEQQQAAVSPVFKQF